MAVTKSVEIRPGRFAHLVSIKFNLNVHGIDLFHQACMDEKDSKGHITAQYALCTLDDLLNFHDTIQHYLFSFIDDIKNMQIDEESKTRLKDILSKWLDDAVSRGEKIKDEAMLI